LLVFSLAFSWSLLDKPDGFSGYEQSDFMANI